MNTAFEGDTFIAKELIKLRDRFGLTHCIETGSQYGSTTIELAAIFENVITIEADDAYFGKAKERLSELKNVNVLFGMSEEVLLKLFFSDNVLYYLDAHGDRIGGCPLKEELEIIASKGHKNVCIAIHDFKVPGKNFGFDTFDYELCYEEIEPYLKMVYPDGFDYHYNEEADGARQGIAYFYPIKKI